MKHCYILQRAIHQKPTNQKCGACCSCTEKLSGAALSTCLYYSHLVQLGSFQCKCIPLVFACLFPGSCPIEAWGSFPHTPLFSCASAASLITPTCLVLCPPLPICLDLFVLFHQYKAELFLGCIEYPATCGRNWRSSSPSLRLCSYVSYTQVATNRCEV